MMVLISQVFVVLYMLFWKIDLILLSHRCTNTGPGSIICYGHVWTEPASLVPMGQNVSINCHSEKSVCHNAKLYLVLNNDRVQDRLVTVINKTTIQLQLLQYKTPFSTVQCNVECSQEIKMTVCGTQFCMGFPPDPPANVTCIVHEDSDNMTCTWDPGKNTYLNTNYKLYLKSLQTDENKMFSANSALATIPLNQLQKNLTSSVLVCAENDLGAIYSNPLHFDLNDIVIPATPLVIQNTTVYSPVFKTIIWWQKRTRINETYCEERYKEMTSETWHIRKLNIGLKPEHYTEYNLEANTKYEFQVRCKLTHGKCFWSNWTELMVYVTPEAEPTSALDVWRYLGPRHHNGNQEVTILIKPFLPEESRGKILGYRVYCEKQGNIVDLCKTTESVCKILVSSEVTNVYVTAYNSKGSSIPANVTVNQQHLNYHDFPPPTNLKIIHNEHKGISVKWVSPKSTGKSLLWYIVEWTSPISAHGIMWKKVPKENATIFIDNYISLRRSTNISVYAVYQDGISKASSILILEKDDLDGFADKDPYNSSTATRVKKDGNDVVVLWGTSLAVASFSLFVLALIAKKSYRKRFTIVLNSVMPNWFFEDYPKIQNSRVVRSLQEESGSVTSNSTGLYSDCEDVAITKVEEMTICKGHTFLEDKMGIQQIAFEKVNTAEEILFATSSDMVESDGYKPQASHKAFLGNVDNNAYKTHFQNLDTNLNLSTLPIHCFMKDYTSPPTTMQPAIYCENTFLFEKIDLVFNNRSEQNSTISSAEEKSNRPLANNWMLLQSDDNIQEQTLIPDELLSSLKTVNGDLMDVMSYFSQNVAK